nr:MAG TPA: hypothetical protein [Caudoviricetes sp.]
MTARATFRFRRQPRRRAGLIAANWSLVLLIMWLTPTASGERSPEGLPEGRNEDASGAPERRLDGSGVRFPAGERSLTSKAKVAQELPSNPSSGANRKKPGEKASTGTREYVAMLKTQSR